jgi:membrane protease YdiL (CAAX protease family)
MKEIKDNIQILITMTLINCVVLWNYISKGETKHGTGYFIFFYVAILTIYFFTKRIPPKSEIIVKEPKKELSMAVLFAALGILFLSLNFMLQREVISNTIYTKIPIMLGSLFFAMPLGIFLYLLLKKYKILQLGLYIKPLSLLLLGIIIWGLTGLFAFTFHESGFLWEEGLKEFGGIGGLLLTGIINAALFEEFSRFVIQSRFEKIYKTAGVNIFFATIIWAMMHFPMAYHKVPEISTNLTYCLQIIPLGFVWGYLTQRTKSILPAIIAHGLNLWGFQN